MTNVIILSSLKFVCGRPVLPGGCFDNEREKEKLKFILGLFFWLIIEYDEEKQMWGGGYGRR